MDFRQLFKLRLVVAALGETQLLDWWNSGVLTGTGEFLFQQGFPRSALFNPADPWRADHLPSVSAHAPAGGRLRERAQPLDG